MNIETPTQRLLFSTSRIEVDLPGGDTGVGTGFFARYDRDGRQANYLVTNKHVIRNAIRGRFFVTGGEGPEIHFGARRDFEIEAFESWWFGHPDPEVDIAVARIPPPGFEADARNIFVLSIPETRAVTLDEVARLDAVEEVIFIGYPEGIYDVANHLPIVRRGITATPLEVDFLGKKQFLIDASVYQGSSGSPVFSWEQHHGKSRRRPGRMTIVNVPMSFVGVISHVAVRRQTGQLGFVEAPTTARAMVEFDQPIGLGVVVKASRVYEAIHAHVRHAGHT